MVDSGTSILSRRVSEWCGVPASWQQRPRRRQAPAGPGMPAAPPALHFHHCRELKVPCESSAASR